MKPNPQLQSGRFVAVTASVETADTLVDKHTIRFEHVATSPHGSVSAFLAGLPSAGSAASLSSSASRPRIIPPSARHDNDDEGFHFDVSGDVQRRHFRLRLRRDEDYPHQKLVSESQLHGPWPDRPAHDSLMTETLRRQVPRDMAGAGLADWETGGQLDHHAVPHPRSTPELDKHRRDYWIGIRSRKRESRKLEVLHSLRALQRAGPDGEEKPAPAWTGPSIPTQKPTPTGE